MRTMECVSATILGIIALVPCGPVRAENVVVVEARGIGYRAGQMVDADRPLILKEGQHLTLISTSGATFKLSGPYNRAPAADQNLSVDLQAKISALVTQRLARAEVGTARGALDAKLPDPWLLDVGRAGKVCVLEGSPAVFWRLETSSESILSVTPADRSWRVQARWPAGVDRIPLKTDVPLHGGATYLSSMDGVQAALTVNIVPAILTNDSMRAAWMAEKGCDAQAEALLRTIK